MIDFYFSTEFCGQAGLIVMLAQGLQTSFTQYLHIEMTSELEELLVGF